MPASGCLDEAGALAFVARELSPGERARAEAHLDGCPLCRRVVSELARELAPAPSTGAGRRPAAAPRAAEAGATPSRACGAPVDLFSHGSAPLRP